jgi:murein DD-endopeptidase MepM/ murein hydrolase activator NlpD
MNRFVVLVSLVTALCSASAQDLRQPFDGRWFVAQGGDTLNVNQHMAITAQWFGIDFVKTGGQGGRELARPNPSRLEDFYSWGQLVRAPRAGTIVSVVDGLPDNPLGTKDTVNPAGNHLVIQVEPNRFIVLAHFQRGSLKLKVGDHVNSGQYLGKCGNSGNSDYPHIHMHIQDQPKFNIGNGQNAVFSHIDVELSGKVFENVEWPLI